MDSRDRACLFPSNYRAFPSKNGDNIASFFKRPNKKFGRRRGAFEPDIIPGCPRAAQRRPHETDSRNPRLRNLPAFCRPSPGPRLPEGSRPRQGVRGVPHLKPGRSGEDPRKDGGQGRRRRAGPVPGDLGGRRGEGGEEVPPLPGLLGEVPLQRTGHPDERHGEPDRLAVHGSQPRRRLRDSARRRDRRRQPPGEEKGDRIRRPGLPLVKKAPRRDQAGRGERPPGRLLRTGLLPEQQSRLGREGPLHRLREEGVREAPRGRLRREEAPRRPVQDGRGGGDRETCRKARHPGDAGDGAARRTGDQWLHAGGCAAAAPGGDMTRRGGDPRMKGRILPFASASVALLFLLLASAAPSPGSDEGPRLYPVVRGGKWGYIDNAGKVAIEPQFAAAFHFSDGLAPVQVGSGKEGKRGYIDRTGKVVIPPQFDWAGNFREGLANVRIGDRMGYIDRTGKAVVPITYTGNYPISDGLGMVVDSSYRFGFVDRSGKVVIPPKYESAFGFSEGLAVAVTKGKGRYIDRKGKVVLDTPRFDAVMPFFEGRAIAMIADRWGFIDNTGKVAVETKWDGAFPFSDGLAAVNKGGKFKQIPTPHIEGGKWGFVDPSGKVAIEPAFDFVRKFTEGMCPVMEKRKWGYIGRDGKFVIPPRFDEAEEFQGVLARVKVGKKIGYIGKTGRYVWEPSE